ncbi:WXG100 family type VII secretion target [Actinoplanes sp. NPDC051494]|uniref:WXG100 family type VII secretion target n=1 Tax=Actinoplanes sp. NPDC051494 TaxID=3363907 RepID=UPI00379BD0DA
MSAATANKLESWFYGLPQLVQEVLQEPFEWSNDALKAVAGDPDAMMAAIPEYQRLATRVQALGTAQVTDRNTLAASWSDDAFLAFSARVDDIDQQIKDLVSGIEQLPDLLKAGADACVEGANMIIDIITSLIMLALSTIAVNVALSIVTLGTSLAAGVAMIMAEVSVATARVLRVIERVAAVLKKIEAVFRKIQQILEKIVGYLRKIEAMLKKLKDASKAAQGTEKWVAKAKFAGANAAVSKTIDIGSGGLIDPPTKGSAGKDAGLEYLEGLGSANKARHAVE